MNTCAICRNRFEAESPAVLFISAYGTKRVLCPHCEEVLDRATLEEDTPEKAEALNTLDALASKIKDPEVLETLGMLLSGEVNPEAPTPEEEAEMEAVLEDVKREEAEAALTDAPKATFLDYLFPALFGAALLIFVIWYFFF
ncbi:MAG: hypothetical protein E7609_01860 [Ruminococcaceae bacterium]|nr:hypothetical protein [Oscillospiraceae bacterium]